MGHTSRSFSVCVPVHVFVSRCLVLREIEGTAVRWEEDQSISTQDLLSPPPPKGFHFKKVGLGLAIKVLFQIKVILMLPIESEEAVVMKFFTFFCDTEKEDTLSNYLVSLSVRRFLISEISKYEIMYPSTVLLSAVERLDLQID